MNRLILIGNGFDLAHNLKTSYCDFINAYLTTAVNTFYKLGRYEDPLLLIDNPHDSGTFFWNEALPSNIFEKFNELLKIDFVNVELKSQFLKHTLEQIQEMNWVDLENDYFEQLLACKESNGFNSDNVCNVNSQFEFLKLKLEEYLISIEGQITSKFSHDFVDIFLSPVMATENLLRNIADHRPENLLLLSFNYTQTLEKYQKHITQIIPTEINYIHGQLKSSVNPIIFGFGDEYNVEYLQFENLKERELMKHIKSFGYFRTSNYHKLLRFLDANDFQVFVIGHSLGLSDRTMLKQIFEHSKCVSIKIFYYSQDGGTNDYNYKTIDISSHFSNKGLMRKVIVPFDQSSAMPQFDKKP